MAIPLTEFSLNYIKNLMTLKVFKKSDFKNIASLENTKEDISHQEKVKKSAQKHIGLAAGIYAGWQGCLQQKVKILKFFKIFQNLL